MEPQDLTQSLAAMDARLTRIENYLRIANPKAAVPMAKPSAPTPMNAATAAVGPNLDTAARITPQAAGNRTSGNWLGIIAVLCFVLAAGFIIKLSVESGWLTPIRQVGIATLFGFALIGAGFSFMQRDRAYASLLPAAGIIVLYATAFATHLYYELAGASVALGLIALVAALSLWLYTRIKHDAYAIAAAVGAYLAPFVLNLDATTSFSLYYLLICSLAFASASVWLESRLLSLLSAYLAIGMTALVGFGIEANQLLAVLLPVHFAIFAMSTYFYSLQHQRPLTQTEALGFLPVLLIFYACEYHFIDLVLPGYAPWLSLGFAGVLVGVYLIAQRAFAAALESRALIAIYATIVLFHSVYLELLPLDARPWLLALILLGAAFLPTPSIVQPNTRKVWRAPILALLIIAAVSYMQILGHVLDADAGPWLLLAFISLGSAWAVLIKRGDDLRRATNIGSVLLASAHLLAVIALYRLTIDIGSLAVSIAWLLYAVAVMALAFMRRDQIMAKSALLVLGFAAGKALLFDAASAPTLVRILCLLLTGAILYGCGYLLRRMAAWSHSPQ